MKNLTFKAAMLKGSRPTVNRRSTDGQSQRHCKQTPLSKRWKVLMTLVFLFTFAIGNVWAAVTYHSVTANIENTNYETYYLFSNGAPATSTNVVGTAISNNKLTYTTACSSWIEGNPTGKDNSGSPGDFSAQGFYKTDAGDLKYNGTSMTFHVTNCVGVAVLGKGNSDTKPIRISVKEQNSSTEVGSVASTTGNKVMVLSYGTTLNASKKYDITVSSVSGGNSYAYQIRFTAPAATKHSVEYKLNGGTGTTPTQEDVAENAKFTLHDGTANITAPSGKQFAGWNDGTTTYLGGAEYTMGTSDVTLTAVWENAKTNPTATFSAGAYVVGAAALDLSDLWSSNSDGAVTYALKVASDDATVSGTSFTATKAGSYVVTASQAATSTYNAIEKEATITVTWPATGAATITYNLDVTNKGTTLQTLNTTNATSSSISVAASNSLLFGGLGKSSNKGSHNGDRTLGINTLAEETADKYFGVTFTVADDYMFTPSAISLKVLTIGGNATSYKAVLTDGTNSIVGTVDATNDSEKTLGSWSGLGTTTLTGDVTLKLYAWYTTSGSYNAYRLSTPITIAGTVAAIPSSSAPVISAPDADQAAVYDLNDEIAALTITASGYPTPTYQWYKNSSASTEGATAIDGAESASYTPANDAASDFYYYCVATNASGSATSHFFHVTVNAPTVPTIYTETTAMSLVSNKVATDSKKFTFSGINLDETPVTLVLASEVDGLTLSTSSVTPTAGSIADTEITVSYKSVVDVAEANVNLYLKHGDDILHTIVLTYSSTAGIVDLTPISASATWNWDHANSSTDAIESLDANDIIVFANYSGWDESFKANSLAGRLQYVYRGNNYAQGHNLKFNTTVPGIVTVSFSNTSEKTVARAPRITDKNGSYAPTDEADGAKTADAKSYSHAVAAGDVLIEGFEMKEGTPANMLRFYEVKFVAAHNVTYMPNGGSGAESIVDDAATEVRAGSIFTAPASSVFVEWNTKADGTGDAYAPGDAVTQNLELYAQWETSYEVTFNMQDHGTQVDPQLIVSGGKVTKPADPSESGWDFGGWFKENTCTNAWNFATDVVTTTTTIFAKWTEDPCPSPFSLSKVVLTSASAGTVTGYNNDEYAGEKVIDGLKSTETAEVDASHAGTETGYKLNNGGSAIVFATLKKGTFQVGDRVVVTITKAQDAYEVEEVAQPILDIYYGTDKNDATFLTTIENVTAAGTYTYRLTAADVTAIGNKKGIGVFRPNSGRTQNPYVYSVEIKGCREWAIFHTLTFKNIDGTATIAAESLEEGAYASTVAPVAPKIAMKRFLGWAEDIDGTPVELTSYTITEDKILYAVYEDIDCSATGVKFSMTPKANELTENYEPKGDEERDYAEYATLVGGKVFINNVDASNKRISVLKETSHIKLEGGDDGYIHVELDCPLNEKDTIKIENDQKWKVSVAKGSGYVAKAKADKYHVVPAAWDGKYDFYIKRDGSSLTISGIQVVRPAKFDVSFNMMGHGTQIADIEDVLEDSKITAPTAPTDADYSFAGWYKENTFENEWNFDVDVVETNTTLYAKWLDKSDATLKSLRYGDTEIALEVDEFTYNVNLSPLATTVPALTAETNNPNATKQITNGTLDEEGHATSTVVVTPEVGAAKTYTVNFTKVHLYTELVDVTGATTWDWTGLGDQLINDVANKGVILANYVAGTNFEKIEGKAGEYAVHDQDGDVYQGTYLHFHTTVPGVVTVKYRGTGNNADVTLTIGSETLETYHGGFTVSKRVIVPAGDVEITSVGTMRIKEIVFNAQADEERNVVIGNMGTVCLPNPSRAFGVNVYELAGKGEGCKVQFDQLAANEVLEAGKAYVLVMTDTKAKFFYTSDETADADWSTAMKGNLSATPIEFQPYDEEAKNVVFFKDNAMWNAYETGLRIKQYRAYLQYDEVTEPANSQPAPGRRRVSLNLNGAQVATGFDNLETSEAPMKVMIDGQLFIIRGEKMFDATGRLVK